MSRPGSQPARRGGVARLLLGSTSLWIILLLTAPGAQSQSTDVEAEAPVDRTGWYWRDNRRVNPPGTGQQQELFPAAAAEHHIQVASENGEPDKRAYVGFDLAGLEGFTGGSVRTFSLTAEVSDPGPEHTEEHQELATETQTTFFPPATSNDEPAVLTACPVTNFFAGGADGNAVEEDADGDPSTPETSRVEPRFDCDLATGTATRQANGARWSFDLTAIAQVWADGTTIDTAVAVLPAPDTADAAPQEANWTVEFHGKRLDGLTASITYAPAGGEASAASLVPGAAPPPPAPPVAGATEDAAAPPPTEEEPAAAPPLAQPVASAARFPWYAALPWPIGLAALVLVFQSLRGAGDASIAGAHQVASRMRSGASTASTSSARAP